VSLITRVSSILHKIGEDLVRGIKHHKISYIGDKYKGASPIEKRKE